MSEQPIWRCPRCKRHHADLSRVREEIERKIARCDYEVPSEWEGALRWVLKLLDEVCQ